MVASEIYEGSSWAMYHKMKNFIGDTAPVRVDPKHIAAYHIPNRICIMMFSNSKQALRIDGYDRRLAVLHLDSVSVVPPPEYWRKLRKWFYRDGGAEAFLHWARTVDLEKFGSGEFEVEREIPIGRYYEYATEKVRFRFHPEGPAPVTVDKMALIESSRPRWFGGLEDALRDAIYVVVGDVRLFVQNLADGSVHDDEMAAALKSLGFARVHRQKQVKVNGQRVVVFGRRPADLAGGFIRELFAEREVKILTEAWREKLGQQTVL